MIELCRAMSYFTYGHVVIFGNYSWRNIVLPALQYNALNKTPVALSVVHLRALRPSYFPILLPRVQRGISPTINCVSVTSLHICYH